MALRLVLLQCTHTKIALSTGEVHLHNTEYIASGHKLGACLTVLYSLYTATQEMTENVITC